MVGTLYTVYMHITPSEKSYIGITKNSIKRRKHSGYLSNKFFTAAVRKYGWENIRTEIIAENVSLDEANLLETYYIASYETQDKRKGYNIADGGLSWNSKTEEVRKKIVLSEKNRKPVECIETGEVFPSFGEAERITGVDRFDISKCCSGKRKTAGKFHWRVYVGRTEDVREAQRRQAS